MKEHAIQLDPLAAEEILAAFRYYLERSPRAADGFLDALEKAAEVIGAHPLGFPIVRGSLRHIRLRKFPYALYYRVVGDEIQIVGCIHAKRHPSSWRSRE